MSVLTAPLPAIGAGEYVSLFTHLQEVSTRVEAFMHRITGN